MCFVFKVRGARLGLCDVVGLDQAARCNRWPSIGSMQTPRLKVSDFCCDGRREILFAASGWLKVWHAQLGLRAVHALKIAVCACKLKFGHQRFPANSDVVGNSSRLRSE